MHREPSIVRRLLKNKAEPCNDTGFPTSHRFPKPLVFKRKLNNRGNLSLSNVLALTSQYCSNVTVMLVVMGDLAGHSKIHGARLVPTGSIALQAVCGAIQDPGAKPMEAIKFGMPCKRRCPRHSFSDPRFLLRQAARHLPSAVRPILCAAFYPSSLLQLDSSTTPISRSGLRSLLSAAVHIAVFTSDSLKKQKQPAEVKRGRQCSEA